MTIELPLRPLHLPSCQNCGAPTAAPEQCNTILATIALTRSTIALTSDQCTGTGGCAVCWGSEWIAGCVTLLTGRRSSEGPSCPPLPPIHSALCSAHAWLHFLAHNVAHFCTAQVHFTTRVDDHTEYYALLHWDVRIKERELNFAVPLVFPRAGYSTIHAKSSTGLALIVSCID